MSRRRFYAILVSRIDPEVFKGMFLKPDGTYRFCREEDERVADALTEHFKPVLNGRKITAWCIYERRSELGLLAKGYEEGWKTRRENRKRAEKGKPPLPKKPRVRRPGKLRTRGAGDVLTGVAAVEPTLFDEVPGVQEPGTAHEHVGDVAGLLDEAFHPLANVPEPAVSSEILQLLRFQQQMLDGHGKVLLLLAQGLQGVRQRLNILPAPVPAPDNRTAFPHKKNLDEWSGSDVKTG